MDQVLSAGRKRRQQPDLVLRQRRDREHAARHHDPRRSSGGKKSLDDVMRYLYNEYFKKGRNYTPQDYQKAAELMAGRSLDDFFSKYVRGVARDRLQRDR